MLASVCSGKRTLVCVLVLLEDNTRFVAVAAPMPNNRFVTETSDSIETTVKYI
jgi:hypothetical protein